MPAKAGIQLLALALCILCDVWNPGFRSPRRRASYFPLLAHCAAGAARTAQPAPKGQSAGCAESRKVGKGKGTPAVAPDGLRPPGPLRCSPATGRRTTRPSRGACTTESVRAPKPAARSISPPLLGPWNHHGPAKRRRTVLAHQASRLERFCRTGSQPQTVRLSPVPDCAPRRSCRGGNVNSEARAKDTAKARQFLLPSCRRRPASSSLPWLLAFSVMCGTPGSARLGNSHCRHAGEGRQGVPARSPGLAVNCP